jgi:CDP-diglyceride synthetase
MRNIVVRSVSGLIFLALMVGSIFLCPHAIAAVLLLSIVIMMYEYLRISVGNNLKTAQMLSIITGAALYIITYLNAAFGVDISYLYLLIFLVTSIFLSLLYDKKTEEDAVRESYRTSGNIFTSILYIAIPFSLINLILFKPDGTYNPNILLSMFILLWTADVGAYLFGMTFGQKNGHKLFPSISPKKSWEGFLGGLICAIAISFILHTTTIFPFKLGNSVIIAAIITIFGAFGDLVESLFKRNFGVKDSGNIMPGHGGLLDRFDGALIAFPVAIAYIKLFPLL